MASRLQDVIQRGLAADKPLATTVAPGTLYHSSDTSVTERSDGSIWESYADSVSGGSPGIHAPTHASVGTDPIDVTTLDGFPGGGTTFLRDDGVFAAPPTAPVRTGAIVMVIDGAGVVITTGVKGFLEIPFACTIVGWTLLSSDPLALTGSIVVDIWKDLYANYPPVVADSIGTVSLVSVNKNQGALSNVVAAGDVLGFNVNSVSVLTKVTLTLKVEMV